MSTRVTNAIVTRRARENLVRLLFPKDRLATGATATPVPARRAHDTDRHGRRRRSRTVGDVQSANSSGAMEDYGQRRHSYSQLRAAYLQRVHALHPDKVAANPSGGIELKSDENLNKKNKPKSKTAHLQFIELKNAWEEYRASVRDSMQHNRDENSSKGQRLKDDNEDLWEEVVDDFTMFGVGCSFADSPEERDLRNEIMEQASRGWFSSGALSFEGRASKDEEGGNADRNGASSIRRDTIGGISGSQPLIKLSDDDMFVCSDQPVKEDCSNRKFLIQNVDRFRRKR